MILATPVLAMTLVLVVADRWFGLPVFDAFRGGDPLLFQTSSGFIRTRPSTS